jgi:hypothetical protein
VPTYEWAVLRVVPRVERGEFVNVGVVLHCKALDYLGCEISHDLSRALALDPGLDVEGVRAHLAAIADVCAGAAAAGGSGQRSRGDRFRWLVAPRSTVVQPSPVHAGISDDPAGELDALTARMVGGPAAGASASRSPG